MLTFKALDKEALLRNVGTNSDFLFMYDNE
jgi:hypothetical protein